MQASLRLAVLIDAENVSHKLAGRIFDLVVPLGSVRVRRLYGGCAAQARGWAKAARRHALDVRYRCAPAKGKNGADVDLAVDAMDLLHAGGIEGFCIISSDGDFAGLARRIRQEGNLAYGIGGPSATAGYRESCDAFFCLDPADATTAEAKAPHAALPLIRQALANSTPREGWYHLAAFGQEARKAGLRAKDHGASGLGALMRATGQFTFKDGEWFQQTPLRAVASGR